MNNKLGFLLTALILSLAIFGFFQLFESYEETKDLGWDTAAKRNPYLAAEQFLRHLQADVASYDSFEKLEQLPKGGTIFISSSGSVLTMKRVDKLLDWIKDGGHLIVAAESSESDANDKLLDRFSIEVLPTDYKKQTGVENNEEIKEFLEKIPKERNSPEQNTENDEKANKNKAKDKHKKLSELLHERNEQIVKQQAAQEKQKSLPIDYDKEEPLPEAELTTLTFDEMKEPVKIHFSPYHQLHHPYFDIKEGEKYEDVHPFYWDGSQQGVHFMQFEIGEGMLSVLSDADIWRSEHIAQLDHAFLLKILSQNSNGVRLFYGAEMPSIFVLLWKNGYQILVSAGFLLLIWLAYRSRRFGPIQSAKITVRRSLAEHINASANYLWRENEIDELLAALRADIEHQVFCKVANYELLDQQEKLNSLSDKSGIPLAAVEYAMTTTAEETQTKKTDVQKNKVNMSEDNFLQIVQCLQNIRKSL